MKRPVLTILASAVGCALLVWLGLAAFGADLSSPAAPGRQPGVSPEAAASANRDRALRTMATASAAAPDRAPPMPREYMILMSRSMFVRGHIAEPGHVGGQRPPSITSTAPTLQREETSLVFNGVTRTDTSIDALIEDTGSGRVLTVHTGDAVARGTVGKITMDSLEYINASGVTTVRIGQNFSGNVADMSAVPMAPGPIGSGASPQDILERLRQKRLQELGGGK